jgi:hypothetical protein
LGAGTGTFRHAAGAAPPDGAALVDELVAELVAEPAAAELVLVVLLLPLLPQPATTRTMATARHALRTEL